MSSPHINTYLTKIGQKIDAVKYKTVEIDCVICQCQLKFQCDLRFEHTIIITQIYEVSCAIKLYIDLYFEVNLADSTATHR